MILVPNASWMNMIYVMMRNVSVFVIPIINNGRILPENGSAIIECKTCGKIIPVSKLEQHVMKKHFWS
jgi:hypothetical protein